MLMYFWPSPTTDHRLDPAARALSLGERVARVRRSHKPARVG
jgi:hypothetical protein